MTRTHVICLIYVLSACITMCISTFDWTEEPGDFRVLAGSNATFIWTYRGPEADLEWSYKGVPGKPRSDVILLYKMGQEIPYGENADRLRYLRYNRSASMVIDDVRTSDVGKYEVKAIHPTEPIYIDSQATISVYKDLKFNTSIDDVIYPFSYNNNDTTNSLPSYEGFLPRAFDVNVTISESSPSSIITIEKYVGESLQEVTTHEGFTLASRISFEEEDAKILNREVFRGQIKVTLDFEVQGVSNITLCCDIIHGHLRAANRAVDGVVVITILTLSITALATALILSVWRDRLGWTTTLCQIVRMHQRENNRQTPYGSNTEDQEASSSVREEMFQTYPLSLRGHPSNPYTGTLTMTSEFKEEIRQVVKTEEKPLYDEMRKLRESVDKMTKMQLSTCRPPHAPSTSRTASQGFDTMMSSRDTI